MNYKEEELLKIQLVGTGSIGATSKSASALIDDKILVDCGNGIVKTLKEQNVNVMNIETILITHLHGDHFIDIPFLIFDRTYQEVKNKVKIFCPVGTELRVKEIMKYAFEDDIFEERRDLAKVEFKEFEELSNEKINESYTVSSKPVKHGKLKVAFGFILKNKEKAIGFSGDSCYCNEIDDIVANSDISVLDMSQIEGNDAHMGIDDIEKIIKKHNKKIIATHIQTKTRSICKNKNIPNLIIPEDGQIIKI